MKQVGGSGRTTVAAGVPQCLALLAAVERYPDWYPEVIKRVEELERDGAGSIIRARATVHVAAGPLARDLELLVEVQRGEDHLSLIRVPHDGADPERFEVRFKARPTGAHTELSVTLEALLELPRLLPLGGVGESLAQGFAEAAKRAIEDSSPKASATSS